MADPVAVDAYVQRNEWTNDVPWFSVLEEDFRQGIGAALRRATSGALGTENTIAGVPVGSLGIDDLQLARQRVCPDHLLRGLSWAWEPEQERRLAEHRADSARRAGEESKRIQDTTARANQLLKESIGDTAYKSLSKRGFIEVQSPNEPTRHYHVPKSPTMRISMYERDRFRASLCVDPIDSLPAGDRILLHKLMIEGNEQEYLRTANWFHRNGSEMPNPYRGEPAVVTLTTTITDEAITDGAIDFERVARDAAYTNLLSHISWANIV